MSGLPKHHAFAEVIDYLVLKASQHIGLARANMRGEVDQYMKEANQNTLARQTSITAFHVAMGRTLPELSDFGKELLESGKILAEKTNSDLTVLNFETYLYTAGLKFPVKYNPAAFVLIDKDTGLVIAMLNGRNR